MLSFFLEFGKSLIGEHLFSALLCLLSFVLPFRPVGGYILLLVWSLWVFLCLLLLRDSLSSVGRKEALMEDPAFFSLSIFSVIQVTGVLASRLPAPVSSLFAGYLPPLFQLSLILSSFLVFGIGLIFPGFVQETSLPSLKGKKLLFWMKIAIQILLVFFVLGTSFHVISYSALNYSSLRPVAGLLMISILCLLLFDYSFPGSTIRALIVFGSVFAGQLVLTSVVPGFESLMAFLAIFCWALSFRFRVASKVAAPADVCREKLNLLARVLFRTPALSVKYIFLGLVLLFVFSFLSSDVLRSSATFLVAKYIATVHDPLSYPRLSSISSISTYLSNSGLMFGSVEDSWNLLLSHNSFLDIAVRQGFLPAVALFTFYLFVLLQAFRKVAKCGVFPLFVSSAIFLYANIQPFLVSDGYGVILSFFALGLACSPFCRRYIQGIK